MYNNQQQGQPVPVQVAQNVPTTVLEKFKNLYIFQVSVVFFSHDVI